MIKEYFTHRVLMVVVSIMILLFIMGIGSYIRWNGTHYFGKVVAVTEKGFVLDGRGSYTHFVDIDKNTKIKEGLRTIVESVHVGDKVIVVGVQEDNMNIKASLVRIMGYTRVSNI
ncbi:MAG: hypothetical protein ACYCZW_02925 [Minisyncoccota bacterium]